MDVVFPSASKAIPPHILEKIFFNANKHHDLRNLRMVSKSWREVINSEALNRTVITKKMDQEQTMNGWRAERNILTKFGAMLKPMHKDMVIIDGINCNIFDDFSSKETHCFNLNGDYIGYTNDKYCPLIAFFECSSKILFHLSNPSSQFGYELRAYKSVNKMGPMQEMYHGLNLGGRKVVGLKWIKDKKKPLLICHDLNTKQIIVINVITGAEMVIEGKFRGKIMLDKISIDEEARYMAVLSSSRNTVCLHMIDLFHGVRLWTKSDLNLLDYFTLLLTSVYACCIENSVYHDQKMVHFFDTTSGLLVNKMSISLKDKHKIKPLGKDKFVWENSYLSATNTFAIYTYCPREQKGRMMGQSDNRISVHIISDVIADRYILLHSKLKSAASSNIVRALEVFDLVEDKSIVVDRGYGIHYNAHLMKNKVLCKNTNHGFLEVLKFKWPYSLDIPMLTSDEASVHDKYQ